VIKLEYLLSLKHTLTGCIQTEEQHGKLISTVVLQSTCGW